MQNNNITLSNTMLKVSAEVNLFSSLKERDVKHRIVKYKKCTAHKFISPRVFNIFAQGLK